MKTNVLIAVPCLTGTIETKCAFSLLCLSKKLWAAGMLCDLHFVTGSLLPFARNTSANRAAWDTDAEGRPFSHILFVDSDGAFSQDDVMSLINANVPIAGLPFSEKRINWQNVAKAARAGIPTERLCEFTGIPCFHSDSPLAPSDSVVPVEHVGCGVLLVQTKVLRALAEAHAEWRYSEFHPPNVFGDSPNSKREFAYGFFQSLVTAEGFLGEDVFFCRQAALAGFQSYLLPNAQTRHTGNFSYVFNLQALAWLESVGAQNPQPAKQSQ